MRELPTGTVTLLFTDIEGSTRLLQLLGKRYADVLAECRDLLRAAFLEFDGHEVDTQGDAFFVAFARASDAVAAAVTVQHALANHLWPEGVSVQVRIGLHTGEPQRSSEGYIGLDVHRAARIMSAGHGGQVLLSHTTRDLVEQTLPQRVSLLDLGAPPQGLTTARPALSARHCGLTCRLPTAQDAGQLPQQPASSAYPVHWTGERGERRPTTSPA
jgi:class 3 adenylate cyclase